MEREKELNTLLSKLKEKEIFEIREDLEKFLQEENDQFTEKLQEAISEKLDSISFPYVYFSDFLSDYQKTTLPTQRGIVIYILEFMANIKRPVLETQM